MLKEHGIEHTYREYTREPLDAGEIREVLAKLGVGPREVLRSRDANKAGLAADASDDAVITAMAANNRLLQRPIGVVGDRAVVGRPADALLSLQAL